jgi:hypothetical protein
MASNAILDELYRVRDALSQEFDGDIRKIVDACKARQELSGRAGVVLPPRRPQQNLVPKAS